MKTKWVVPALVVGLLFLWTARENFEDTATVQGPPYGNTGASAQQLIDIMPPTMLKSIKTHVGVTSETPTAMEKIKIVYGNGTNSSPIAQVMSNFYWQIYKPATSTISVQQVNNFLELQTDTWVKANIADTRQFLTTYFIRGQNGAAQSGYLDSLNTVWGQLQIKAAETPAAKTETEKPAETLSPAVGNTLMYVSIGIAATSIFAVLIVLFLPPRNVS